MDTNEFGTNVMFCTSWKSCWDADCIKMIMIRPINSSWVWDYNEKITEIILTSQTMVAVPVDFINYNNVYRLSKKLRLKYLDLIIAYPKFDRNNLI